VAVARLICCRLDRRSAVFTQSSSPARDADAGLNDPQLIAQANLLMELKELSTS